MNPYKDTFDYNDYSYNEQNYWEKQQSKETKTKKKVSFDDILSNMNLIVNSKGVLQMMTPIQNNSFPSQHYEYNPNEFNVPQQNYQNPNIVPQNYQNPNIVPQNYPKPKQVPQNYPKPKFVPAPQKPNEPLDPIVKHSYIYNKYFKDYVDQTIEKSGPRVPKTLEEYKQMVLEDKIKAIQHKRMIEQIKPKKMMFTSNPGMSLNPSNINASKNNLRMMNFR
jgi:hypothetical protein